MNTYWLLQAPISARLSVLAGVIGSVLMRAGHSIDAASRTTPPTARTVLEIEETRFTLNGQPTFLLGNGSQRNTPDNHPRCSLDLRSQRLFGQLDPEERKAVAKATGDIPVQPEPVHPGTRRGRGF